MKKIKLMGLVALTTIMMLTSCLGDSTNEQDFVYLPGVFAYQGTRMILYTRVGPVYADSWLATGTPGQTVLASFHINYDDPANENAVDNNYYVVTPTASLIGIDDGVVREKTDTITPLANEFALKKGVYGLTDPYLTDYINGQLILTSLYESLTDQRNYWEATIDPDQEPNTYNGKNVYTVFIRASISLEGKTPKIENMLSTQTYNIQYIIDNLNEKEKGNGTFYLQFCSVSEIEEGENEGDLAKLTWTKQDDYFGFLVTEDSESE